jgi:F-type H+-transporting ATPase subunit delta
MVEDRIGYRYARSVYELAQEQGTLAQVYEDMGLLDQTFKASREFTNSMRSPIIPLEKKAAVAKALFGSQFRAPLSLRFVELVIQKNRAPYLKDAAEAFLGIYDQAHNIARGSLTSAAPFSPELRDALLRKLEGQSGKTYQLEEKVNPDLLGGFVLEVGDLRFDGSVAYALRKVKQNLSRR